MRRLLVILGLVGVLAAEDAATAFQAVRDRYSKVKSLTGQFKQTVCSEDLGYCMDLHGKFSLRRPNLFRLDVSDPERQVIVSDGEYTWFYWPDSNLVRKTPGGANPFFDILLGSPDHGVQAESVALEEDSKLIVLVPVDSMASFRDIRLNVSPKDYSIMRIALDDGFGTVTKFELSHVKRNPDLPAKTFVFAPPEGTVVEE